MDTAIYARLSRNRSGLSDSVEIQTAEARSYSDEKLWIVVLTTSDDDISASKYTTKPRPGYDRLVAAIERGEVEVIIATEMTRLYRRLEELLQLIKMAERTRLRAIWTTDDVGYDLSTPEGIHQAIGAVNNAMLESAKISKRVKRKKAASAKAGLPSGGGRPFGYEMGGLVIRESEAEVLREGRDRYIAGETIRDIVRDLNKRGVTTAEGKPWRIENFQRSLLKKRYIGIREHNGVEHPAVWPAIFTVEEWQLMEARRTSKVWRQPRAKGGTRSYLLTGFTYCGRCGGVMIGSRKQLAEGSIRRYRCRTMDNYGIKIGCGTVYRAADALEAWITEAVFYRFDSPEVTRLLSSGDTPDRTDELVKVYQEAKTNLDQMVRDYATGFLSRSQFGIAKTVAEDELQRAKDDLAKNQSQQTSIPVGIDALREAWESGGIDYRRSVIMLLVEKVVCLPGSPGSHLWKGWRFQPDLIGVTWRV